MILIKVCQTIFKTEFEVGRRREGSQGKVNVE